jgi:predicted phage baseplate assembly protein
VLLDNGFTVLVFETALKHTYIRSSVTLNANVALATHGETISELLGSGDASRANQKFVLKQVPMTYVSADTTSGVRSTLELRVDGILWEEVSSLYGHDPDEHIFTTSLDDDGNVTVQFGDGINGARLTSGQNNLRATYRKGIGLGGLVKARQLDQLMTRPLGLKAAINPLPTRGADAPEQLADARDNAPLTVLTLDRAVSLQDYEDFSRAFAGIAKSLAIEYWDGNKKQILITVAGPDGAAVEDGSVLHTNLSNAILGAGDPLVDFRVVSYRSAPFRIAGNIMVDPTYIDDDVLDATKSRLRKAFSFTERNFGQPVMLSEVIAVIQEVAGVIAVDIDSLYRTDSSVALEPRLNTALPEKDSISGDLLGSEILLLDSAPLTNLGVIS